MQGVHARRLGSCHALHPHAATPCMVSSSPSPFPMHPIMPPLTPSPQHPTLPLPPRPHPNTTTILNASPPHTLATPTINPSPARDHMPACRVQDADAACVSANFLPLIPQKNLKLPPPTRFSLLHTTRLHTIPHTHTRARIPPTPS
eukprot:3073-Chlamydomonas_euryale.AAC.1